MCSPEGVVLSNRFAKEMAVSYSGAHIGATAAAVGNSANLTVDKEITCIAAL